MSTTYHEIKEQQRQTWNTAKGRFSDDGKSVSLPSTSIVIGGEKQSDSIA